MAVFELDGLNGQLTVYEDKVVIERKGFWGFATQGLAGSKTIPMTAIQSIQFKSSGFLSGYIQFSVLGGKEAQGGVWNATDDENTIMFKGDEENKVGEKIKEYIEKQIIERSKPQSVVQQVSAADEIIKLKQLLDMGVITSEEFNAKKKQLLGL